MITTIILILAAVALIAFGLGTWFGWRERGEAERQARLHPPTRYGLRRY